MYSFASASRVDIPRDNESRDTQPDCGKLPSECCRGQSCRVQHRIVLQPSLRQCRSPLLRTVLPPSLSTARSPRPEVQSCTIQEASRWMLQMLVRLLCNHGASAGIIRRGVNPTCSNDCGGGCLSTADCAVNWWFVNGTCARKNVKVEGHVQAHRIQLQRINQDGRLS